MPLQNLKAFSACLFPIRSGSACVNLNSHSALVKQHHYNTHCYFMENLNAITEKALASFQYVADQACVNLNSHSALIQRSLNNMR